jgi:ASC-1-like (ASCH) protein
MAESNVRLTEEMVKDLKESTCGNRFWERYLEDLSASAPIPFSVHLAVLLEPYLRFILDGSKTVESRFSKNRIAPFNSVEQGDVILLKKAAAKAVSGVCVIRQVWYYQLDANTWDQVRDGFTSVLRAEDPSFWEQRKSAQFATLMRISEVQALPPIEVRKHDRRGWVVLRSREHMTPNLF